ncbi:hypothetical protein JCM3766R1_003610 [Sporobolomyces carnicolor]
MPKDNFGNEYSVTSSGTNDQGNHYCSRDYGDSASNSNSYHSLLDTRKKDSNNDGSYYYSNSDGSSYYNSGDGYASYSKSDGSGWTEGSKSSK